MVSLDVLALGLDVPALSLDVPALSLDIPALTGSLLAVMGLQDRVYCLAPRGQWSRWAGLGSRGSLSYGYAVWKVVLEQHQVDARGEAQV